MDWVLCWCLIIILGSMTCESSSEIVLIVDRNPNFDHLSSNYSIKIDFNSDDISWPGRYCKRISSQDDGTITSMCEYFKPLVFVKTDANGDQTTLATSKIEYRGLPDIKLPRTPKIWDGRRPDKALIDKFFSQETFMAARERFHKKLQFAKLEYRTLA